VRRALIWSLLSEISRGPKRSTSLDLADLASELLGHPIRRRVIADDELSAKMAARGAPPQAAAIVLGLYRASRQGELCAAVDPRWSECSVVVRFACGSGSRSNSAADRQRHF
jgi:hypothetical protein